MEDANGGSDRAIFRGAIGDPMDIPDEYYYQLVLRNQYYSYVLGFLNAVPSSGSSYRARISVTKPVSGSFSNEVAVIG
jgi:hypothetical protein